VKRVSRQSAQEVKAHACRAALVIHPTDQIQEVWRVSAGTGFAGDSPFVNRMTGITITAGNQTRAYQLTHDANGNLRIKQNTIDSADRTEYRWDSNNRLIGITQPGLTASFTYDALGRRIQSSITQGGQTRTVQYLYEGQQHLGEIRDGKISHRLLTGLSLDETIARLALTPAGSNDAAGSRLYLTDALNSVIAQLNDDAQATLANSYAYSPFGESQVIGIDGTGNPVQYTSRENDGTGLMFYRARYYDPVLKRFVSTDPIGLRGGMNGFVYVEGNPLSYVDPEGLVGLYSDSSVTVNAYPGSPAGGNEHARHGPGQNYHVHMRDSNGRDVRISTETWRPLTPQDQKLYDQSKAVRSFCENLSDGERRFFDRVNRQVFHKGYPTVNQMLRLGGWRGKGVGRAEE